MGLAAFNRARRIKAEAELKGKPIDEMTVTELKAYAADNGIDLTGASKKDEILAVIREQGDE